MDKKDEKLVFYAIIYLVISSMFFTYIILKDINDLKIDHKCYMMSDEEFFQTEMCEPYWSYRQVGKK